MFKSFFHVSVLYRKQFPTIYLESFYVYINILVERVTCSVWTSNSLALTMLMVPHYWLIENQNLFINKSRNAMVLKDDFLIYSGVICRIMHLFFSS
ncbi:hypothetical protein Peur_071879 [Populus x canadensis]